MIKNGNLYCDYCHKCIRSSKELVNVKRSTARVVTINKGTKKLSYCNMTCAYKAAPKKKASKKANLDHLSINQKEELLERLNYQYIQYVYRYLKNSNVDGKKFTEIVLCDEPQKRRDEFYKLFKYENDADALWVRLMGWFYCYTEEEIEAEMWETVERVHRALGMYNKTTLLCGDEI